jgi:hypothetical protein
MPIASIPNGCGRSGVRLLLGSQAGQCCQYADNPLQIQQQAFHRFCPTFLKWSEVISNHLKNLRIQLHFNQILGIFINNFVLQHPIRQKLSTSGEILLQVLLNLKKFESVFFCKN